jgi:hypothetical protein
MLLLGEVHTGLLQHSTSLPSPLCRHILGLVHGEPVRQFERPIAYAVSPDLLAGVDCHLPTSSGAKVRAIGTVIHRAALIGGHVLQGSTVARVTTGEAGRRLPWPHYLARPGAIETIGTADQDDLLPGFLAAQPAGARLDLGAIAGRVMDAVQASPELDRNPPVRMPRVRLRWVAVVPDRSGSADSQEAAAFSIEGARLRTLRLGCHPHQMDAVVRLCEDIALHDWLLTALVDIVERSRIGTGSRWHTINRLRPAIDHVLHLWMPGARVEPAVVGLWDSLERHPGFSRQWLALVSRIRDQVALATLAAFPSPDEEILDPIH